MHNPSEQDFIQQLSIDCVIFGYHNKALKVLVSKLNFTGDFLSLPGGFIYQHEDIDKAATEYFRNAPASLKYTWISFMYSGHPHGTVSIFLTN